MIPARRMQIGNTCVKDLAMDELIQYVSCRIEEAANAAPCNQIVIRNLLVESTNLQLQLVKALTK